MPKWKKLKLVPKEKAHIGCLFCSTMQWPKASMKTRIWGEDVTITKDKEILYFSSGDLDIKKSPTLRKFENMARKDPSHDWQFVRITALHDEAYQRQGLNNWIMVKSGRGYA